MNIKSGILLSNMVAARFSFSKEIKIDYLKQYDGNEIFMNISMKYTLRAKMDLPMNWLSKNERHFFLNYGKEPKDAILKVSLSDYFETGFDEWNF